MDGYLRRERKRGKSRWRLVLTMVAVGMLAVTMAYRSAVFVPSLRAKEALRSSHTVRVTNAPHWWKLTPSSGRKQSPSIIFYPGLLADSASYSPWARSLAEAGYPVYLVKMPLHFSPLAPDRASSIMKANPNETFVIGGHSLGGAVAAKFAASHSSEISGLFLMASFVSDRAGQAVAGLPVLQIAASKDGIIPLEVSHTEHKDLPATTEYAAIRGGNHQQFASFAEKWHDYPASITELEQHRQITTILLEWLKKTKRTMK